MKLLLATRNKGKVKEIQQKFSSISKIELLSIEDIEKDFGSVGDVIEDGETFAENALKKARTLSQITGLPTMADDSGLVIDALGGEPGIYSARYAGEGASDADKNFLILEKMKNIPKGKRTARFVCAIALVIPNNGEFVTEGICEGEISAEPKGSFGFGYDPIFFLPEYQKTMAELPLEIKNSISHRAKAIENAVEILNSLLREHNF
ncbi:MAG: XTP/dITP diphosphatase [Spirochaetes bacterium]|nr:XTP/dITP diphosphatase [Spirochaetota bacterium]